MVIFLLASIVFFGAMYVLYSGLTTLQELDIVESARDRWQRPSEVLAALNLRDGNVVADVGSGAGYFALKLAQIVGSRGKVLAIDLRRLSLSFLWIRAALRGRHNVQVVVAEPDDPHLPAEAMDAVLIANTYHEFSNADLMLDYIFRCLHSGGRLVIVDRSPTSETTNPDPQTTHIHTIALDTVARDVHRHGFRSTDSDERFINRGAGDESWWLLVAVK